MTSSGSVSRARRRTSSTARELKEQELDSIRLVNEALDSKDLRSLRKYAAVRGLINHQVRSAVWPLLLLGSAAPSRFAAPELFEPGGNYHEWAEMTHRDSSVVAVDVERSLWSFTVGWSDADRAAKRVELRRLLNAAVNCHGVSNVHYYQGLHDIASVLLLVMGSERAAFPLLAHLVTCQLRDCTRTGLDAVVEVLPLLLPILDAADPPLAAHVRDLCPQPYFALTWVLTWFSHDSAGLNDAARIFDLFLSSHPLMPLYFGAAMMLDPSARAALMRCDDMPDLHTALVALRPGGHGGGLDGGARRGSIGGGAAGVSSGGGGTGACEALGALTQKALFLKRVARPETLVPLVHGPILTCVAPAATLHDDAWQVPDSTPTSLTDSAGTAVRHSGGAAAGAGGPLGMMRFVLKLQAGRRAGGGGKSGLLAATGGMLTFTVVMVGLSMAALMYGSSRGGGAHGYHGATELLSALLQGG